MDQVHSTPIVSNSEQPEREMAFIDLMIVLAKHKRKIIYLPLVAAVVAFAISFALPKTYRANTKLLPPQQGQSGAAALLSQLGGVAGALASSGIKNPNEMYIGMLRSRSVVDKLVEKFSLKTAFETDSLEKARKILEDNTFINSGKDGLITIEVQAKDPKAAADIANAYVDELINLTKALAVTEASKRRLFFEKQLELSKNNLAAAEFSLKNTLDTRGVISVDADSRAIVETISNIRAKISAKEIQLSSMSSFVTPNNPEYRRTQEELNSLKAELSKLENGRPNSAQVNDGNDNKEGLKNIKILRNVKYYQMLYEVLAKQYEAARLDEAKDSAIIQVLDPAVIPERKFSPKRAIITVLTGLFAFIVSIFWAFISEASQRLMHSPNSSVRLDELKVHLGIKQKTNQSTSSS
jgi:tyrosine-protein kinase Etk/Wzc